MEPTLGVCSCSGADVGLRRRLVTTTSDGGPAPPELAARAWALFRELLRYVDARTCRHDFILRYFGDEQELLGGCGHCDICGTLETAFAEGAAGAEDTARAVRMALSAVARARGRAGLAAVAEMLRGIDDERTRRFGFTTLSTFGLLRERSGPWVMDLLRGLLAAGWIDITPTEHPVPVLTPVGEEVMRAKGPVRFALPREGPPANESKATPRRLGPGAAPPAGADSLDDSGARHVRALAGAPRPCGAYTRRAAVCRRARPIAARDGQGSASKS